MDFNAVRAKLEASNTSMLSESGRSTPSSLYTFLLLYSKANQECYTDYMKGATILYSWLTDDGKIPLTAPPDNPNLIISRLLSGYESSELSMLIAGKKEENEFKQSWLAKVARIERAVYSVMINEII